MRDVLLKSITALAIVASSMILSRGLARTAPFTAPDQFSLLANKDVLYRLDKSSGRIDVLIPAEEGAYLVPVWQMSPQMDSAAKISKEEQEKWGKISLATSQYLRLAQGMNPISADKKTAAAPEKK